MQITLTTEQEARLMQLAVDEGKTTEALASEFLDRALKEEAYFRATVHAGIDAAERGEFLEPSEVWAQVEKVLQS